MCISTYVKIHRYVSTYKYTVGKSYFGVKIQQRMECSPIAFENIRKYILIFTIHNNNRKIVSESRYNSVNVTIF